MDSLAIVVLFVLIAIMALAAWGPPGGGLTSRARRRHWLETWAGHPPDDPNHPRPAEFSNRRLVVLAVAAALFVGVLLLATR